MSLRPIAYEAGGVALTGYLADGSGGRPAPGVLVAPEAMGLGELCKAKAEALAQEGYVAFALDPYGATGLSVEEARRHASLVMTTPGLMHARTAAALDVLAVQ